MTDFKSLYHEAVTVSNAAEAFADLVEFETTKLFVENVQKTQKKLVDHILTDVEDKVISAAAAGLKYADVFEFKGNELFEEYNILFMIFGGAEQERREQLGQYGFAGCFEELLRRVAPFYLKHTWNRETNNNTLTLFWE